MVVDHPVHHSPARWVDARALPGPPSGLGTEAPAVRTRGIYLAPKRDRQAQLWIPETPGSEELLLRLEIDEPPDMSTTWPHVEVDAVPIREEGSLVLRVLRIEELPRGISIHHPYFHAAPRPARDRKADSAAGPHFSYVDAEEDSDLYLNQLVEVYGEVRLENGTATLRGIEVAPPPAHVGSDACWVRGELQKWVVTARMLRECPCRFQAFCARGPGTYWRLVDPDTGNLAVPHR